MKKYLLQITYLAMLAAGCSPSTHITGSWRSPDTTTQYRTVLVAALTSNTIARNTLEQDLTVSLGKSVNALKSIDEFPPDINGADSSKTAIMSKVQNRNVDGILTISLLRQETETRYMRDRSAYSPLNYPYYNSFWGYYSHWYPQIYNQGYYTQEKIYFIETNLYDAKTEKLVWSAQSKTYDPDDLGTFSKEFAGIITAKMKTDRVIPATVGEKSK